MKTLVSPVRGRYVVLAGLVGFLTGAAPPPAVVLRPPRVLAPVESAAAIARVGVRSYVFDRHGSIYALDSDKGTGKGNQLVPVRLNRLDRQAGIHLAESVRPLRLVVIAAGFPYREQAEEFRRWLGWPSVGDVLTRKGPDGAPLFRFMGVELQRRTLRAGGKPASDYQPIDLVASFRPWAFLTGRRFEADPVDFEPVLFPGLVMPRPLLLTGQYPAVEERLLGLDRTVRTLGQPPERFRADTFDVFGPAVKPGPGVVKPIKPVEVPDTCLLRVLDVTAEPAHAYQYRLRVRMADPRDVLRQGGVTRHIVSPWYELPDPVVVPPDVRWYAVDQNQLDRLRGVRPLRGPSVQQRTFNPERQVMLQAHRWVTSVRLPNWLPPDSSFPFGYHLGTGIPLPYRPTFVVGDWVVAERFPVARGEYVECLVRVEVPVWRATDERFLLAEDPDARHRTRGVAIDFTAATGAEQSRTLLVDFTGGKVTHEKRGRGMRPHLVTDAVQIEVLALTPDGKLVARGSAQDADDAERADRLAAYRERIEHLRKATPKTKRP